MKRAIFIFIASLFIATAFGQKKTDEPIRNSSRIDRLNNKPVNFGFRAGFNSSLYLVSEFKIKDVTIDEIQNNYKIGYLGAFFVRINFGKHYLQPEALYQISRSEITFDKLGSQHPEVKPDFASIHSRIHSLEFPLLYGYNIIKKGPYGMSVFAGPKLKYHWKKRSEITFENFDQKDMQEKIYPLNLSIVGGVGVNISRIFFDFRYEQGISNISKSVTYDNMPSASDESNHIIFRRRDTILSFSLGVMF